MAWAVEFDEEFKKEYDQFDAEVKEELTAKALTLGEVGPQLGRPHVDTLKGSKYVTII